MTTGIFIGRATNSSISQNQIVTDGVGIHVNELNGSFVEQNNIVSVRVLAAVDMLKKEYPSLGDVNQRHVEEAIRALRGGKGVKSFADTWLGRASSSAGGSMMVNVVSAALEKFLG